MPHRTGDVIELDGRVRATRERDVLLWRRIEVGERSAVDQQARPFEVETSQGVVEVRPPSDLEGRLVPAETWKGEWNEIDAEVRHAHADIAPGPGFTVTTRTARVRDGDRIVIHGRVAEIGPERRPALHGGAETKGDVSYRDALASTVTAVDAEVIAVGDRAEQDARRASDALAPQVPRRPFDWMLPLRILMRGITLAPVVALAVRTALGIAPAWTADLWVGSLAWWALGAVSPRRARPLRVSTEVSAGTSSSGVFMALFFMGIGGFIPALAASGLGDVASANDDVKARRLLMGWILTVLPMVLVTAVMVIRWMRARRFQRLFDAAPEWNVVDAKLPVGLDATQTEVRIEPAANSAAETLSIGGAVRATDEEYVESGSGRFSIDRYYHKVSPGGRALIAGRFEPGDTTLRERGPGSLALFGVGPGDAPRAVLEKRVSRLQWLVFELTAIAVVAILVLLRG